MSIPGVQLERPYIKSLDNTATFLERVVYVGLLLGFHVGIRFGDVGAPSRQRTYGALKKL